MTKYLTITLLAAALAQVANAQELSHEFVSTHTPAAAEREVTRIVMTPRLALPEIKPGKLDFSTRKVTSRVPSLIQITEPVEWKDTLPQGDTRGYAVLGIGGPLFSIPFSAGYRIFDDDAKLLKAWMQYDGEAYRRHSAYWRSQALAGGLYGSYTFNDYSRLDADVSYHWSRYNRPDAELGYWVRTGKIDANALWTSRVDGLEYIVGAGFNRFGYSIKEAEGANDWAANLKGDGRLALSESSAALLNLDFTLLHRGNFMAPDFYGLWENHSGKTSGLLTIIPAFSAKSTQWGFKIGPRVDFSFNAGKAFHIAPLAEGWWTPLQRLTVALKAGGGEHINRLADLHAEAQRSSPVACYGFSHIPLTVDLQATYGPNKSFWGSVFGGWAKANDWLMPDAGFFNEVDIKGFHGGVALGGAYRSLLSGNVRYEVAQGSWDKGYYLWRDRAKHVLTVHVEGYPIDKLTVSADYRLRACRAWYETITAVVPDFPTPIVGHLRHNLGNLSRLTLGGTYQFMPRLSFFANVDVSLTANTYDIDLTPASIWVATVGASYKF